MVVGAAVTDILCRASKGSAAALPRSCLAMKHTVQQITTQKEHCASPPRAAASHAALLALATARLPP
eukprot:1544207-Alexandrium_andersonii.AAC.1